MKTTIVMITLIIASQMVRADVASQIVKLPPNQGPRLRLGPKPPVERFPPQPYTPPPTPEEKEETRREREALAAVQVRRKAAVAAILDHAAISTNGLTRLQIAEARTAALEAAADVLSAPAARSLLTTRTSTILAPTPIKSKEALP